MSVVELAVYLANRDLKMTFEMSLEPDHIDYAKRDNTIYRIVKAGNLTEIAEQLFIELRNSGYSLMESDVLAVFINEVQFYSAWAELEIQRLSNTVTFISENTYLYGFEWAIIEPVVRAHCDLVQARLMETVRSVGMESFGLSVSEANDAYQQARQLMKTESFVEPPFSIPTLDGY